MTSKQWAAVGALAGVGVLLVTWRRTLPARPLAWSPFDPVTSDLTDYGPQLSANADQPSTAQINATDLNSPTYSRYGKGGTGGFVSTFVGRVIAGTWGVPRTTIQSPSIPNVGIVSGVPAQRADLITAATAQQSPSVSPDPDVAALADADPTLYDADLG